MQSRRLLVFATRAYCWPVVNRLSPGSLLSCLLSAQSPSITGAWDYSLPGARLGISLRWALWDFCLPISPPCQDAFEWQPNHLVYQPFLQILYHLDTCWACTLLSRSLMKTLNCTQPSNDSFCTSFQQTEYLFHILTSSSTVGWKNQHGVTKGESCLTNLIALCEEMTSLED